MQREGSEASASRKDRCSHLQEVVATYAPQLALNKRQLGARAVAPRLSHPRIEPTAHSLCRHCGTALRSNYSMLDHCKPIMQVRVAAVSAKGVVMLTSARSLHRSAVEHSCHMCQCRFATGARTGACSTILEGLALGTAAFIAAASTRSLRRPTNAHTAGVSNYCQHSPVCHSAPPQMSEAAHTGLQPVMRCKLSAAATQAEASTLHSPAISLRFSGSAPSA